jgi:putative transposase
MCPFESKITNAACRMGFATLSPSYELRNRSRPVARKRERGIWQRRYWEHAIHDEDDFARHVDYIHFNPVKHGHVRRVRDWQFSSFHRMVWLGVYPPDWAGDVEDPNSRFGERQS